MIWKSKKTFLVFLSVVFGSAVILGSAKIAGIFGTNVSFDSPDGGGWVSALSVIPGYNDLTQVEKGNAEIAEKAYAATTTTDLIARRLIIEYGLSQRGTATSTMSDAEAEKIANILASEVTLPQKKQYKLSDLNISTDNNENALISYRDAISSLIKEHMATEKNENEISIVISALDSKDPARLSKLKEKAVIYQQFIDKIIALKTPSSVSAIHLHFLQTYEILRSATIELQKILTDPAIGIAALTEYRTGFESLVLVEQEYRNFFSAQ